MEENKRFQSAELNEIEMDKLKKTHRKWREWTTEQKVGFFPIFMGAFAPYLQTLSGNALKLYLFLGKHAENYNGELTVSVQTMQEFFGVSRRTIHTWLKELEDHQLIKRIQPAFKQTAHTFILPYHQEFLDS